MEQSGEYRIDAEREKVWQALNDPDVLARCLDGCQSMERAGDDHFVARVKARVGPVRATFDADLTLEDVQPPDSYTINASVKGGPAGFARGSAHVVLSDDAAQTLLRYTVQANIGGKLAQVGSRLIDGAARKMADDFFARFREEVQGAGPGQAHGTAGQQPATGAAAGVEPAVEEPQAAAERSRSADHSDAAAGAYESGGKWMIWAGVFAALLVAMILAL